MTELPQEIPQVTEGHARAFQRATRRKIMGAIAITAISVAATCASCVGQSFSYRQARALESIDRALTERCRP